MGLGGLSNGSWLGRNLWRAPRECGEQFGDDQKKAGQPCELPRQDLRPEGRRQCPPLAADLEGPFIRMAAANSIQKIR